MDEERNVIFLLRCFCSLFSRKDHKRHIATIAVRRMNQEHSGDNICTLMEEILREWDIPTTKIGIIMTDSDSNNYDKGISSTP